MSFCSDVNENSFSSSPLTPSNCEERSTINLVKNFNVPNEEFLCRTPKNHCNLKFHNNHTPREMSSESQFRNSPYTAQHQLRPALGCGTCHSDIDQDSLNRMTIHQVSDINNNNVNGKLQAECQHSQCYKTPEKGRNIRHMNVEVQSNSTLTSFGGLFPCERADTRQYSVSVPPEGSDVDIYRQSYLQNEYGQQHFVEVEETKTQQVVDANGQQPEQHMVSDYSQYSQYGPTLQDEQIAAEQLASELCSNYGGPNSHMISDILKRNNAQQYGYGGFERPADIEAMQQFDNMVTNQNVIHDVDLLNTPQQLPVDEDSSHGVTYRPARHHQEQFGDPQACSTPDSYQRQRPVDSPHHNYQASVTYNDVHLHGGRWSSQNSPMFRHQQDSESPFPPARNKTDLNHQKRQENYQKHYTERGPYTPNAANQTYHPSPGSEGRAHLSMPHFGQIPANDHDPSIENQHIPTSDHYNGFKSPNSHSSSFGHSQHEVTKMTFTPREMMETHLSQNYRYQKKSNYNQHVSDYSSIYPSKEFIERTTSQKAGKRIQSNEISKENLRPKKKSRTSKYSTEDVPKVPPQMPIFDNMFQKYAPIIPRDETHSSKHKYFVVNPSEITNMASKSLITKYIDFLILENEQITEISKSTNPPVDIYVTEDMYFMDSLKFNAPFPSKKFIEWVASFYPRLNLFDMKFKGRRPQMPQENKVMKPDSRPTQQILEDTFYFFQREAMNLESEKA